MASEQLRKDLLAEYFKIYEAVQEFDRRLIAVLEIRPDPSGHQRDSPQRLATTEPGSSRA